MHTDIAVVGASSAGLLAAYWLVRHGRQVVVLEQQPRFRPRPRTLIVTAVFRELLPFPEDACLLHTTPWMTVAAGNAVRTLVFHEADRVIDRALLLHRLMAEARQVGATIWLGHRLSGLHLRGDGSIELHLQRPHAPLRTLRVHQALILADGVFSDGLRLLGLPHPPAIPIVQARVALPKGWDPRRTQVWFYPEATRYFYWLIPEGPEWGVLGVMTEAHGRPAQRLVAFAQKLGLSLGEHQGGWVALYRPGLPRIRELGRVRVYVVGDAAGQVKNTTVGGTVTGFLGAQAAVQDILGQQPFARAARSLYRELFLHWLVRRALHHFSLQDYERLIRHMSTPLETLLSRVPRDRMAPVLVKGLFQAPGLWPLTGPSLWSFFRPFPPKV